MVLHGTSSRSVHLNGNVILQQNIFWKNGNFRHDLHTQNIQTQSTEAEVMRLKSYV